MIIKLNRIFVLICVFIKTSEQWKESEASCSVIKEYDKQCGYYCYTILKPLLQYTSSMTLKEQKNNELESKVHELELTIKHFEEIIKNKEIQLTTQIELAKVYKEKNIINEELIREKNKQISDLKIQISQNHNRENLEVNNNSKKIIEEFVSPLQSNRMQNQELNLPIKQTEIGNHDDSENIFVKYVDVNCIGKTTDAYMVRLPGVEKFVLPCDSKIVGSGWTVIQRRQDGTENFNRNWTDYQKGFGNIRTEFFIGLEKLYLITNAQPHYLYIYLEDFNNDIRYATYQNFAIDNEHESYALKTLGEYSGNAENALLTHKNKKFSTPDHCVDNAFNCAENYNSGWWFNDDCYLCNLNAPYVRGNEQNSNGIEWRTWHFRPLKFVQMMIKPKTIK
ncbi:angiopoietin-related protein 7-like [Drosophila sulfurigaster albostrigata]|uniref:angiopoietin-related protein 7-like n=1 Tax=Drosophila sulfurigaster albostrigata TaxID=89887 RepID=UPI002D21A53E|nr:angiopoietin-related protein 7-like [Drosophila sulfurigaster albostrigata]